MQGTIRMYGGSSDLVFGIGVYYATLIITTMIEGQIGRVMEKLLYDNGGIIYKIFAQYPSPSQTWDREWCASRYYFKANGMRVIKHH